jgi:hypothetical protein
MIPLWVKGVMVVGVLSGLAWTVNWFLDSQQQKGYDRAVAEYNVKLIAAQTEARIREQELLGRATAAQEENQKRERQIATLTTAVAKSSASLRDALAAYGNSLSGAPTDALRRSIERLGGLLEGCSDSYRGMAESAERERNAKQTLIEAWPR